MVDNNYLFAFSKGLYEVNDDPTYDDAVLDRLAHNASRIELVGERLRCTAGKQARSC